MSLSPSPALADRPTFPLLLGLAAAYAVAGRLALLLAIPPGFASPVWPAAGIALMALLIGGRRLWPGVMLGSILSNLPTPLHSLQGIELLRAVAVPLAIGGGAALQAVLGAWAIRRWVGLPDNLSQSRDILWLLTLGGPLSCLVSATVGVAALLAGSLVLPSEGPFHWWTWWAGDTIGVLIVVPLVITFIGGPGGLWRHRRRRVGLPILITTGAVLMMFIYARGQEQRQLDLELSRHAVSLANAFEKHLDRALGDLRSIEGLFAASGEVEREEFRQFARRILAHNPAFQALSWNPRVYHHERPAYEAAGRIDGFPDYGFTEAGTDGLQPAAERPQYVAVHFIEPYAGNEAALGFDIASNPSRRATLERARDTGQPAATPGIRLVQEAGEQIGVLILMPIYANGARAETLEERRQALIGYATGVLRVGDAIRVALVDLPRQGFVAKLMDSSIRQSEALLADLTREVPQRASSEFTWSFEREFGGRIWSLRLAATPELLADHRSWDAWLVLAGGSALIALLWVLLLVQSDREAELAGLNERLERGIERRRRLEDQREGLISELEMRNTELERFSYTVSHDLKSPLTTIKGFLGLLEKDLAAQRTDQVEAEIAQLHKAADRMRSLVDDLLELSRAGHASGPAESLSLNDVAREVVSQVASLEGTEKIRIDVAPDLPSVSANRSQLLEVLQNLVDNAVKFTSGCDAPHIEIGATARGNRALCHVRDNGIGIDPAHHQRVFGLFNRLDPTREGTGIGLTVVRRIVEMHGGSVWVESAGKDHGCTFYFTLPRA